MASESDVIILSCLTKAPATAEATCAVRSALQRVIVRTPLATIRNSGPGGLATAATAGGGVAAPNLRAIFPSAHSAVVDSSLLRAFTVTRARTILAGLSSLPAGGRVRELPTVVAGIAGGPAGLCFLGQRATSEGYSAFSIRRDSESEGGAEVAAAAAAVGGVQALRIDDLIHDFGGRARASARALYDLWGTSNGDVLGAALQDGASSSPFARLATEWDCSSHATRTLGSPPPPACSSLLLIGGACPPSPMSVALRASVETLSAAAAMGQSMAPQARRRAKGPFGRVDSDTGAAASTAGACSDVSLEAEQQEQLRWREDLLALLSGSENMAELASRPSSVARAGDGNGNDGPETREAEEEDTAVQERKDGGGLGEEEPGSGRQEPAEKLRGDLDFSERLWELAARATDVESVRSAVSSAFDAVGDGQIFPVISRDNKTAAGSHIRDGVALAREARYHDGTSVGVGKPRDEAKAKAWRDRGSAMLADTETLARAFVELGVHKVSRDLLHGLEVHAGVLAADVNRVLPAAAGDRPSSSSSDDAGDRRLDRLLTLADTLDLVALAQSYGAPWRQVRALAHSGLVTLRRSSSSSAPAAAPSSSTPSPVFSLGLPKPIPPRARCKLAHPVFWELYLEPTMGNGVGGSTSSGAETVSYTIANAGLFQLKGVDEPPVLSREAARAAQAALRGVAEHLIPEVLLSVTGVESFGELKRRQLGLRAKGGRTDGAAVVFVCEHRFTPW